jgi:molybdopterin-guanine dinucleotide biosynthesis protein A
MMEMVVLKGLVNQYKTEPGQDGYVYTNEGEPEPLCGIYCARGLAAVKAIYDRGELVKHSMKFMLDHLSIAFIPIPETWKLYFRNINAHADLNGL